MRNPDATGHNCYITPKNNPSQKNVVRYPEPPKPSDYEGSPYYLTDFNPQDKPWDTHRAQSQDVQSIYETEQEFQKLASRINNCSGTLGFAWCDNVATGETKLKLRSAQFCRVRNCPVCQWRRSLMWQARFYQALPTVMQNHPKHRWLFLTLTVRNCHASELRETIKTMNDAFKKLTKRKEFKPVTGWLRTTEVTRGKDGSAHPHFHVLLLVPPSWFTRDYVKQQKWRELWGSALKVDYDPVVNIQTVKPRKRDNVAPEDHAQALAGAVAETLKYAVKPSDMTDDPEWFLEITRQCHKLRFVASGGVLKNVLKVEQESDADMVHTDDEKTAEIETGDRVLFDWRPSARRYARGRG